MNLDGHRQGFFMLYIIVFKNKYDFIIIVTKVAYNYCRGLHPVTIHQPCDAGFSFILPPTGLLLLPFDLMLLHKIANIGFK